MPRSKRTRSEINSIKEQILEAALDLIIRHGFDGFSMRKLGNRLGVSAKTIYNYYQNKDALYLSILTRGFEQLLDRFNKVSLTHTDPMKRLKAMGREYLTFGLEHSNIYNLMFTWHVPKFKDYVGTPMESAATIELQTALKVSEIFMQTIKMTAGSNAMPDETARFHMVRMWSQMHGYVAGINNTLLEYLHEDPMSLKDQLLEQVFDLFCYLIKNDHIEATNYPIHSVNRTNHT